MLLCVLWHQVLVATSPSHPLDRMHAECKSSSAAMDRLMVQRSKAVDHHNILLFGIDGPDLQLVHRMKRLRHVLRTCDAV